VQKVFILSKDKTVAREVIVEPGRRHGDRIELVPVQKGTLDEGALVVVRGQSVLADGTTVKLEDGKPDAAKKPEEAKK
jgi:multidrug efflux pump subunit AcrA (membrane-fusion protein)